MNLRRKIYVSDKYHLNWNSRVRAFDLVGKERGEAHVLDMTPSPSGHFADSLQEDGADSWEVYDAASKKVLVAFGCDKPGCKPGDRHEGHYWNPLFDGQFIALNVEGDTCDLYQSAPPHLVKSIPCGGMPVFDWSRDGREFITLEYKTGKFRREPVN